MPADFPGFTRLSFMAAHDVLCLDGAFLTS
jgi:hypothetical protein